MALSRKKWNYIIIIASVMMISVLSFITNKTSDMPNSALPLFDEALPLKQLQLNSQWLQHKQGNWRCAETVLNCQQWAQAWQNLVISALKDEPVHTSPPSQSPSKSTLSTSHKFGYYLQMKVYCNRLVLIGIKSRPVCAPIYCQ
ncbi:hypothetical protein [Shewanella aestuarii]|uniref:Uncharacterized protein n=1 Tax=Shewanella aestuarii TaxID=1028752 RepID=A0A6G9QMX7_9GAMM|nr:hypothetical protein [Shewanella aestuarii]QIR15950.1 hypothetical protein HBH39_16935 [Shewanella aestuarii]